MSPRISISINRLKILFDGTLGYDQHIEVRKPHICLSLNSGMSPVRHQVISWTTGSLSFIANWEQI